eukprot:TRINITY_DN8941_c0_g1_i3.p1 TRINITY_DN8941_c0_g1~~TRINITY_DN8941_c0_g1_i3.p1  ORF type:complete len:1366 (+),score=379.04 TRINITY_DN8941_c0_g1_i3:605-4702(+)
MFSSSVLSSSPFGMHGSSSCNANTPPMSQDSVPTMRCVDGSGTPRSGPVPPSAPYPAIPRGLVQRIQTSAENNDDPFQRRSIVLLRDMLVCSPKSIAAANSLRTLIAVLADPEHTDLHTSIVYAVLYIIDDPKTRSMFRLQLDFQTVFAPFTEKLGRENGDLKKRLKCAKSSTLLFLRSWVGLMYLASDPRGLKPLIDSLRLPGPAFRKMTIFEVLHLAIRTAAPARGIPLTGPWSEYTDEDGEMGGDDEKREEDTFDERRHNAVCACAGYSVLDIFLGSLLLVLEKAGLTETLIALIRTGMGGSECCMVNGLATACSGSNKGVNGKGAKDRGQEENPAQVGQAAAQLLQTTLLLSSSLFPGASSHKLYRNFDKTIAEMLARSEGHQGLQATSKVRNMTTSLFHKIAYSVAPKKEVRLDSIKLQMSSNMEDAQFRILLNDSQVTTTKDWNKWNCETALFLIKGPLRLHTRLQETLKTKFFKRLLTFVKPRRRLFSELPYKEENLVYSTVACGLIDLLLQSKEGMLYLSASGLLEEIRSILNEVTSNAPEREKVLCKERIMYFMAREYFKIIGKCSESPLGVELLIKHNIFKSLQHLMEKSKSRDRDDICHQILKHLNFGRVGNRPVNPEAKQIFANAMTEGSRPIRLFATLQLRNSFRLGYRDSVDWALDLLVAQLSDSWREVAKAAHEIINEWCMLDDDVLDSFISKKPGMQIFTRKEEKDAEEHAHKLLLRMLTREAGFVYLHDLGVVNQQLQEWRGSKAMEWVVVLERNISKTLAVGKAGDIRSHQTKKKSRAVDSMASAVLLQPHLFGEMAKTQQGCDCLRTSQIIEEYMVVINQALGGEDALWFHTETTWGDPRTPGREMTTPMSMSTSRFLDGKDEMMQNSVRLYFHEDEGDIKDLTDQVCASPRQRMELSAPAIPVAEVEEEEPPKDSDYTPKTATGLALKVQNSMQLRAALWALAHIASSETGYALLQSHGHCGDLVAKMVKIATQSESISLRGTMMCILSVVGHSQSGQDALAKQGWVTSNCEGYNSSDGVWYATSFSYPANYEKWAVVHYGGFQAVPCNVVYDDDISEKKEAAERLFRSFKITTKNAQQFVPELDTIAQTLLQQGVVSSVHEAKKEFGVLLLLHHREHVCSPDATTAYESVLYHIRTMANPVMVDGAGKALKKIRHQDPTIFQDPYLALEIHDLINTYRFRPTARKYLYDTFIDHAVYSHDAFSYVDLKYLPLQTTSVEVCASDASHQQDPYDEGSNNSGRSSPAPCPVSPSLSRHTPREPHSVAPKPSKPLIDLFDALSGPEPLGPDSVAALIHLALQAPESLVIKQVLAHERYQWNGEGFSTPLTTEKAHLLAQELRRYTLCG